MPPTVFPKFAGAVSRIRRKIFVAVLLGIGLSSAFQEERPVYSWTRTAALETARQDACAVAIPDNRVLVAGGVGPEGSELSSVEIYQADETFQTVEPMHTGRSHAVCLALQDGRVLVAGGKVGGRAIGAAEIFDPADGAWKQAGNDAIARFGQTATLLRDGKVLLTGGESDSAVSDEVELFDPETSRFETLRTNLTERRKSHAAALIDDGWVLITGGEDGTKTLASSDLYDPVERTILTGPQLPVPRARHSATALLDGRVLVAGGTDGQEDLASTLLYNNADISWSEGPDLKFARQGHVALRIPNNGSVLIAGGSTQGVAIPSSELYRVDGQIQEAGPLTLARLGLVMAAREDGVVLAAGGVVDGAAIPGCGNFISPTIALSRTRAVRNQSVTIDGQNWPASQQGQITFQTGPAPGIGTALQFSSTGSFSRTHTSFAAPGQVITVQVSAGTFRAQATYRIIARTTTVLTVTPPSGTTFGNTIIMRAEVRPEEINGPISGVMVFHGLIHPPPPAPPVPTIVSAVSSLLPAPGTFSRDVNEFGYFALPLTPAAGLYSLAAVFLENGSYAGSTSVPISNFSVARTVTPVQISTSPTSLTAGQSSTVTVTVPGIPGPSAFRPTGRVTISTPSFTGFENLDSSSPPRAARSVSMPAGSVTISAQYEGNSNYLPSIAGIVASVQKGTIPLTLSTTSCTVFEICPVTVHLNTVPLATGQVTLVANPPQDTTGSTLNLSAGNATFNLIFTAIGTVTRVFNYSGDVNYNPNTLTAPIVTGRLQVPLHALNSSLQLLPPTITGERDTDIVFVAALQFLSPGVFVPPAATGQVRMSDGISADVVAAMVNIGALRGFQFTRRFRSPGTYRLTFTYAGDQFYAPASTMRTLIVN